MIRFGWVFAALIGTTGAAFTGIAFREYGQVWSAAQIGGASLVMIGFAGLAGYSWRRAVEHD